MKSLGILIRKPEYSQKFEAITTNLNKGGLNPVLFVAEYGPIPSATNFPMMDFVYALNFPGVLIATDMYSAMVVKNALKPTKRFFYPWDMEYLYAPCGFDILSEIYLDDRMELLARNQTRYEFLENTWKKPHSILEDFNYDQLKKLL